MENQNKNEVYQIDEKLAKAIVNRNFYFSAHGEKSEFSELPGHFQRAIEREAAFQVKTLAQTEGFAEILTKDNMEEAQNLHNAICEYYAHKGNLEEKRHPNHPSNLFSSLLHRDSAAIAFNPFEHKDEENLFDKTSRRAKHFNEHIAERKAKGIERKPIMTIQNIYDHVKGNIR